MLELKCGSSRLPCAVFFFPVLLGKKETGEAWIVYAASIGSILFVLCATALAILLWRRRRSRSKHDREAGAKKIEMESMTTTAEKTKRKWKYSLVNKAEGSTFV